jgi:hypothetical protein
MPGMSEPLPPSKQLYQLVAIGRDRSRTVLMTGMELSRANAVRDAIPTDNAIVWFQVEREPDRQAPAQ